MNNKKLIVAVLLALLVGLLLGHYLPSFTSPSTTLLFLLIVCCCGCGASYYSMSRDDRKKPFPYLFICGAFLGSNLTTIKSSLEQLKAKKELVVKIKDANRNRYLGFVGDAKNIDGRFISFVAPERARTFLVRRIDGGGIQNGDEVEIYVYTNINDKARLIYPDADNSLKSKPGYRLQCQYHPSGSVPGVGFGYDTTVIYCRSSDSERKVSLVPTWGERQGVLALLNESKEILNDGAYGLTFIQDPQGFYPGSRAPSRFIFEFQEVDPPTSDGIAATDSADTPTGIAPAASVTFTPLIPDGQCSLAWHLRDSIVYLEGEDSEKNIGPQTKGFGDWQSHGFSDWGTEEGKRQPLSILHNGGKAFLSRHRLPNGFGFSTSRPDSLPETDVFSASVKATWDLGSDKIVLCYQPEPAPAGRFIFYTTARGGFSKDLSGKDRSD